MQNILDRLDSTHRKIATAIDPLDLELFQKRPAENEWSVAEVIHHLRLVEERVLSDLTVSVQHPTAKVGLLKKLIPLRIVSFRFLRVKAPKAVQPLNPLSKDEELKSYSATRTRLKEFCSEHGRARLKKTSVRHPFFGDIDGVAAISMVSYHERRHYKQIREILKKLAESKQQTANSKQLIAKNSSSV
jgi:hypothetical protein